MNQKEKPINRSSVLLRHILLGLLLGLMLMFLSGCGYTLGLILRETVDNLGEDAAIAPVEGLGEPETQDIAATTGTVGERVEVNGVGVTVRSVEEVGELNDFTAAAGQTYIVVDVLIENGSSEPLTSGMLPFSLQDVNGGIYINTPINDAEGLRPDTLEPGEQVEGLIAFEGPITDLANLTLTYEPVEFFMNEISPIEITLGSPPPIAEADGQTEQPPSGESGSTPPEPGEAPPTEAAPVDASSANAIVTNGGNLRSEPRVVPETVLGQVCPGDRLEVLQPQGNWARVRVVTTAGDCVATRSPIGAEGWLSTSLFSDLTPAPNTPPAQPTTGDGVIINNGGNIRSEPRVEPETVLGQVCPGDEFTVLEQTQVDTTVWYRIRVTVLAGNCTAQRVAAGTEGWVSALLVNIPEP